ncbi:MAG: VOC family protein [Acidimicrobiia bacterium]|nr:VOC family protein [Acidimicrobiia bacterium]
MEVLSSRVIVTPRDFAASRTFYEHTLGLAVFREWRVGVAFHLGGGVLELTAFEDPAGDAAALRLWLQVRDVEAEQARLLAAGVAIHQPAQTMPWGLVECWLRDPDGVEIRLVEIPPDHPLRRR